MKKVRLGVLVFCISCFVSIHISAQLNISGFVKDEKTHEVLIGAHVLQKNSTHAAVTDNNGFFGLMISTPASIQVSYLGYESQEISLKTQNDTLLYIYLTEGALLEEVSIHADRAETGNSIHLNRKEMLAAPSLGATPDVMKTLQLETGIQSQNEGSSLLMVRGGNPGENLYLLDNIPLIYVNHLGGFMSVFNPEMINNVTLYKGAFPPKYGGKLSSVVDITQREGSPNYLKGSFEIGLTGTSFSLEGPLKLNNSSFIVTGRKTFTELLYLGITSAIDNTYKLIYGFHDVNAKFSWKPNEKSSLFFNIYQGDDYIRFWSKEEYGEDFRKSSHSNTWGNWMASLRFNRVYSSQLFNSISLSYTRYRLNDVDRLKIESTELAQNNYLKLIASVQDIALKTDWQAKLFPNWDLHFGLQSDFYIHQPNKILASEASENYQYALHSVESALYLNNLIKLFGSRLKTNLGLRGVNYSTKQFSRFAIEPRLMLSLHLTPHQNLNMSFTKMNQHAHLVFTPQSFLNNEVWIPAGQDIPYASSSQITLGWKIQSKNRNYQAELQFYRKTSDGLTTYREGFSNILGDRNWQQKLETDGAGKSIGLECSLQKNVGKLTGHINYTYSNTTREFPSINSGEEYIFEFDRPHVGSLGISYQLSKKVQLSANWIYQTGLPYTPAIGRRLVLTENYTGEGDPFMAEELIYGARNSARLKDYHRLDLALIYNTQTKRKNRATWTFSIYNAYNRKNPYYYYFNADASDEIYFPSASRYKPVFEYQVSFFPIIPSVSYKVYFESRPENPSRKKGERLKNWLYQKN